MSQQELNAEKIKQSYKDEYEIKETNDNGNIVLNMVKKADFFNREFVTAIIHGDGHIDWY